MNKFYFHIIAAGCLFVQSLQAYPPAPHHVICGAVRDQYGFALEAGAEVIFESSAGVQVKTITAASAPGINYELRVPMDSGITSDLYRPTALRPTVAFKMRVKIGQITYLPIEMKADFSHLGEPGQKTILNLTLGEDSDGDGIPDAWEQALLAQLGSGHSLSEVTAAGDADGDGLSNLDEYLAGTYAYDDKDGFRLEAAGTANNHPLLKFTAVRGRSYTILGSIGLTEWTPIQFKLTGQDSTAQDYLDATQTRPVQIEALIDAKQPYTFYKLIAQ